MRLVCDQGACLCACEVSSGGSTTTSVTSGSGSSGSSGTSSSGGPTCWTDTDCLANGSEVYYCDLAITFCGFASDGVAAAPGSCHRDCRGGSCLCQGDLDCPDGNCEQGVCVPRSVLCPAIDSCTAACPLTQLADQDCPFCLCSVCPVADAGTDACGGCGPGTTCCSSQGGVQIPGDAGPHYGCSPLGTNGGCPSGAVCSTSPSGQIESCGFYFP
jgi:hypothetical protein